MNANRDREEEIFDTARELADDERAPLTIESMENLAACYENADRKHEAEALRREAAELKAKAKAR